MPATHGKLLALANREFGALLKPPVIPQPNQKFKAIRLNLSKFDSAWDRKRGSAVRLAGLLLNHDDAGLIERVCESERSARTYASGVELLRREGAYLRKVAKMLEMASERLSVALDRCAEKSTASRVPPSSEGAPTP